MFYPFDILLVAAGGAVGAAVRYFLSGVVDRRFGELFPWGTLVVNVSGALVLGGLAGAWAGGQTVWLLVAVGGLGSYTTVSSFSLQTLALLRAGDPGRALLNVALSTGLCLGGAAAGYGMTSALAGA